MKPARRPSPQAVRLLSALIADVRSWRYGYDLTKETGLAPGTLYPLLERFEAQGVLESEWRPSELESRPPRHAYRLTRAGVAFAAEWTVQADARRKPRDRLRPARE
jgi:DNA-binding PadR family transcriptional regulator